ncbi:hypothetical protein PTTG_28189 [Puccinia triticina 1-1 BBBD Race 1]|uniref:Uncharacterized protein n=1 Tax=Puccinia triticina (isolate 1-1 / race 1 (BBBD)) TaxID=630390 RepID=A0A180GDX9_PUCT1|nr:hypothetical protein PTTG_28189 [Puccinia triticina 1-1 BBBD Race 1]
MKWSTYRILGLRLIVIVSANDEFTPVGSFQQGLDPSAKSTGMRNEDIDFNELDEWLSWQKTSQSYLSEPNGQLAISAVEHTPADLSSQFYKASEKCAIKSPRDSLVAHRDSQKSCGGSLHVEVETDSTRSPQAVFAPGLTGTAATDQGVDAHGYSGRPYDMLEDFEQLQNLDEIFDLLDNCALFPYDRFTKTHTDIQSLLSEI